MLTVSSGNHLRSMIMKSPALRELNVSCNKLAEDGGRKILEGIFYTKRVLMINNFILKIIF